MGADIEVSNARESGGEPVADLRVRASELRGIEVPEALVPLAIDEIPVLCIAAACAQGETVIRGAEELRVKESDRISTMSAGLQALGVSTAELPDGLRIQGRPGAAFGGGMLDSAGDHRIAMSFSIASLRAAGPILIRDVANVATSFPGYFEAARSAGLDLRVSEALTP
jgi:5-enolpyruvylshikimate-3-phosphate synthase